MGDPFQDFMNRWLSNLITGTALTLTGCLLQSKNVTFQERVLQIQNPTSYEFNANVSEVKSAIKQALGDEFGEQEYEKHRGRVWKGGGDAETKRLLTIALQLGAGSLFFKGDADSLTDGILAKPGNENDAYFYGANAPVGEFQVYFKDGQPLIYFADFHIHLTVIDPRKTRVEIYTYDSIVNTGVRGPNTVHGRSFIYVKVKPTTVEEYQILLRIGEKLGTKNMPLLVTPGPDAPVKELTKPRDR